ncbi:MULTISPECIES: flavin reductase [Cupriavidus]
MHAATEPLDARELRDVLGNFVTGVTVITTRDPSGKPHGVTANSFSSVSLDPPLILWSQSLSSRSFPAFRESDHFVVNILADDQTAISNHFAKSGDDKFASIDYEDGHRGAPVLPGSAAYLECTKVATYPGGDHVVYLGKIERFVNALRRPLAFGAGKYMVTSSHELAPSLSPLGTSSPARLDVVRHVISAMPAIAESLGEHTLCLAVWGNRGPTAIHWEPSRQPVSDQLRLGLVMGTTQCATGKAFAAFLPPEITRAFIDEDLRMHRSPGEDTHAQREALDAELLETRTHGIARATNTAPSRLHNIPVNAFSAPIFDRQEHMVLALSVTAPASRMASDWDGEVPQRLRRAAQALSELQ